MTRATRLPVLVQAAAVCVLAGLAWMHGATPSVGASCMAHQAPVAAADHDHAAMAMPSDEHGSTDPRPLVVEASVSGGLSVLVPSTGSAPQGHPWMTCVAILVALLLLASSPLRSIQRRRPRATWSRLRSAALSAWPKPPDLMELSVLRT